MKIMKVDIGDIVRPNDTYFGLSYQQCATLWCNWLFSDLGQEGSIYFLRGNVDLEPPIVITGENALRLHKDTAIFFPLICSFTTRSCTSESIQELDIEKYFTEEVTRTSLLYLSIDEVQVPNLRRYFAASPKFLLEVAEDSIISHYFDSTPPGKYEALVTGYWIYLKALPSGRHRIIFEGQHNDGFRTSGDYTIEIKYNSIL